MKEILAANKRYKEEASKIAEWIAKWIDDKIRWFGITEENAKEYNIKIHKIDRFKEKYEIYKWKEKLWDFTIDFNNPLYNKE